MLFFQAERVKQQQETIERERETTEKMAAHAFAQSFLTDLVPSVYEELSQAGYFFDPVSRGRISNVIGNRPGTPSVILHSHVYSQMQLDPTLMAFVVE